MTIHYWPKGNVRRMNTRRILWHRRTAVLVILPSMLALASCGSNSSSDKPDAGSTASTTAAGSDAKTCRDVKNLRSSITQLKDVPLTKDGLSSLSTKLDSIQSQAQQLAKDAHGSLKPQLDALSASVNTLKTDVQAAVASPSGTTLSGLPSALVAVGTAAQNVSSALPNC
jgi:hypothetical protein